MAAAGGGRLRPRVLTRAATCVLAAAGILRGASAQRAPDVAAIMEEREIRRGEESVRLVNYRGQLYQRIVPDDLRALTVGDTELHGLLVCIEGKLGGWLDANRFRLMGSDRLFVVADRNMLAGVMQGGNVWLGGIAQRVPQEASCYMAVRYAVRLPRDKELFNLRFAKYVRDRNWQLLLELGKWIDASSTLGASVRLVEDRTYKALKDKAVREALKIREKGLGPDDAEGWYEVAVAHLDLLGRAGRLAASERLRRAVAIDGTHERAQELLKELGYVLYEGRWMTRDEYDDIQREKMRLVASQSKTAPAETPEGGKTGGATSEKPRLTIKERLVRLVEIERRVRKSGQGLVAAVEDLKAEDEAVAGRIVWILANTRDVAAWQALLDSVASLAVVTRRDVADALAWSEQVDSLGDMIRGELDSEVRWHGVNALSSVDKRKSVGALVSLASHKDRRTRSQVAASLQRLTGQPFTEADDWNQWWRDNEDTFGDTVETP